LAPAAEDSEEWWWEPLDLEQAAALMRDFPAAWWVAGGWALDLFTGTEREHDDVDVVVLRSDQELIRAQLPGWDIQIAHSGRLEPWPPEELIELPRSGFWARSDPNGPWELQFLLAEHEGETWWYRRDPAIRLPLAEIGLATEGGIPYLRPEIVLLYKARIDRDRDTVDFDRTLPKLDGEARSRLSAWLAADHPWQAHLGGPPPAPVPT
jgi:hypothetical protein